MSTFCEQVLKSWGEKLSEEEVKQTLDPIIQLFLYLTNNAITKIYCNQLDKQWLNSWNASKDSKKSMIAKIKIQCGNQVMSKMEGMLGDSTVRTGQHKFFAQFLSTREPLTLTFLFKSWQWDFFQPIET